METTTKSRNLQTVDGSNRFKIVPYEAAQGQVKEIYDDALKVLGARQLPNWVTAMGGNPRLLKGNWEKTKSIMGSGKIPMLLKELIIFSISTKRGSEYCSACHAHSALQLDKTLTFNDLRDLVAGKSSGKVPQAFQTAIEIITKSALSPNEITDVDFDHLREAGYDDDEIGELFSLADLAVMFNTITSTYRLTLDDEYCEYKLPD